MNATFLLAALISAPQSAELSADPRLKDPITIQAAAESCETVCRKLSELTNVTFKTLDYSKDDLIVLYAKERPAHEVLTRLAKHFGWEWTKDGNGYLLKMPAGAIEKERRALTEQLIEPYIELQSEWAESLKQPPQSAPVVLRRMQVIQAELDKLYESDEDDEQAWERVAKLESEISTLAAEVDPAQRFAKSVFVSLSKSQLSELDSRERLVFSYRPTRTQYSLGANSAAAEALVSELFAQRELVKSATPVPPTSKPDAQDDYYSAFYEISTLTQKAKREDVHTVRVTFSKEDFIRSEPTVSGTVVVLDKQLQQMFYSHVSADFEYLRYPYTGDAIEPEREQKPEPAPQPEIVKQLPRKLETVSDKLKDAFDPMSSARSAIAAMFTGHLTEDPLQSIAIRLIAISEAAELPFIGDAYDSHLEPLLARMPGSNPIQTGLTFGQLYAGAAEQIETTPTYSDGWVSFRTNNWQLARATTVPRKVLARTSAALREGGGVPLRDYLRTVSEINDLQARSPLVTSVSSMMGTRNSSAIYFFRGLALLSPSQQTALESGTGITFADMTPAARQAFWEFLFRKYDDEMATVVSFGVMPDFDEMYQRVESALQERVAGSLQTAGEPAIPEMEEEVFEDTEVTQLLPDGPLPDSKLELKLKLADGVHANFSFMSLDFPVTMTLATYVAMMSEVSGGADEPAVKGVRPARIAGYAFSLAMSPKVERRISYSSATSSGSFGEESALPESLRAQLAKKKKELAERRSGGEEEPPPRKRT